MKMMLQVLQPRSAGFVSLLQSVTVQKIQANMKIQSTRTSVLLRPDAWQVPSHSKPVHLLGKRVSVDNTCQQPVSVAGVPVWSFDNVSIDSELDSVCTEQVRKHLHMQPGRSRGEQVTHTM